VFNSLLPEVDDFEAHPVNREATIDNDINNAKVFFIIYTLSFSNIFSIHYFR
jgi:hypothetical protein